VKTLNRDLLAVKVLIQLLIASSTTTAEDPLAVTTPHWIGLALKKWSGHRRGRPPQERGAGHSNLFYQQATIDSPHIDLLQSGVPSRWPFWP